MLKFILKSGSEDTMTKKAEEHMSKISGDFCNWLRDLPGEDKTVNYLVFFKIIIIFLIFRLTHLVSHNFVLCLTRHNLQILVQLSWLKDSGKVTYFILI